MFENQRTKSLSHMHGLLYLEILKGWLKDSIFSRQHKMVHEMLSSLLINQKHTEFRILIKLQYNNSQSLEGTLEKVCKN